MASLSELLTESLKRQEQVEPSAYDFYTSKLREGVAGGVGNLLDAPARLYQLGKAGIGTVLPRSVAAPDVSLDAANYFTNKLKETLGVDVPLKTQDEVRRILGGIVEGVGAGVTSPARGVIKGVAESGMLGGLAGGGVEAAGAISGDNPLAMIAGGIGAGVVAPALVQGRLSGAQKAADVLQGRAQTARTDAAPLVENLVTRQLRESVAGTPNAAENITDALALRQKIPGFNPSVAEMSGSPGAAEMQRRYALLSPKNLNTELARDKGNVSAVQNYYESIAPQGGQPSTVRSSINQTLADQAKGFEAQGQGIASRLPVEDQFSLGGRLSQIAEAEKTAAKVPVQNAYDDAFNAAGDQKIDISPVIAKVEEILGQRLSQIKPDSAPQVVSRIAALRGDTDGPILATLRDADAIRKALNADIASGQMSLNPMAGTRLRNLGQVHASLDDVVASSAIPDTAKQLYSQALSKYREEFVPRFKEGVNLKVFKDTSLNEPRIQPDRFVAEYLKTDSAGGVTNAKRFGELFGKNQEAKDLAGKGILDLYRLRVVDPNTGLIDIASHNQFIRDYGRTLTAYKAGGVNAFDDIRGIGIEAAKVANATQKLDEISKVLRYDNVDDMADAALRDSKVMGNLTMRLNDDGRKTLSRIIMDKAMSGGSAGSVRTFLDENAKTLKMVLPEKHISDLKDISKALEITERAPVRGAVAAAGPDILKNTTGVSMATVWAQMRATTGNRQGAATMAFNLAAPVFTKLSQTQFDDVMQKALHDPKTATELRNFLLADTQEKANIAGRALSAMKFTGNVLWSMKGPILKYAVGSPNYLPNLAASGGAMSATINQE